jgi:hypothetical protein
METTSSKKNVNEKQVLLFPKILSTAVRGLDAALYRSQLQKPKLQSRKAIILFQKALIWIVTGAQGNTPIQSGSDS